MAKDQENIARSDEYSERKSRWVKQNIEEEDIHDHWSDELQTERRIPSTEQDRTTCDLKDFNRVEVIALGKYYHESSGIAMGRWKRDEMQEGIVALVMPSNNPHSKKTADGNRCYVHSKVSFICGTRGVGWGQRTTEKMVRPYRLQRETS